MKKNKISTRLIFLLIPYFIFILAFLPFATNRTWKETLRHGGIIAEELKENHWNLTDVLLKNEKMRHDFPFLAMGQNVFLYKSHDNHVFEKMFFPEAVIKRIPEKLIWILCLMISGYLCAVKNEKPQKMLLIYTAVFVMTSPAIANQYLAIPCAFAAALYLPLGIVYHWVIGLQLLLNPDNVANTCAYVSGVSILLLILFIHYRRDIAKMLHKFSIWLGDI